MWWYVHKGERIGPRTESDIVSLRTEGTLDDATPVWTQGWSEWRALGEIPELAPMTPPPLVSKDLPPSRPEIPPPLPDSAYVAATPKKLSPKIISAGRWSRFIARTFDIYLFSLPVGFALGVLLIRIVPGFADWISDPGAQYLFGILTLPLVLLLEALVHELFGASPGKAMFALIVTDSQGKRLGFGDYLRRNFELWTAGLACGIPLVNLFTYSNQAKRLESGKQTAYDEVLGTRVFASPIGWVRKFFIFVAVILLLLVQSALLQVAAS